MATRRSPPLEPAQSEAATGLHSSTTTTAGTPSEDTAQPTEEQPSVTTRQWIGDGMVEARKTLEKHYRIWSKVNYVLIAVSASYLVYRSRLGTQFVSVKQIPLADFNRRRLLRGHVRSFTAAVDQQALFVDVLHQPPLAWLLPSRLYASKGDDKSLLRLRVVGVEPIERLTREQLEYIGLVSKSAEPNWVSFRLYEEEDDTAACDVLYTPQDRFFSKRLNVDLVGSGCARFKEEHIEGSFWFRRALNRVRSAQAKAQKEKRGVWEFEDVPPKVGMPSRLTQGLLGYVQRLIGFRQRHN